VTAGGATSSPRPATTIDAAGSPRDPVDFAAIPSILLAVQRGGAALAHTRDGMITANAAIAAVPAVAATVAAPADATYRLVTADAATTANATPPTPAALLPAAQCGGEDDMDTAPQELFGVAATSTLHAATGSALATDAFPGVSDDAEADAGTATGGSTCSAAAEDALGARGKSTAAPAVTCDAGATDATAAAPPLPASTNANAAAWLAVDAASDRVAVAPDAADDASSDLAACHAPAASAAARGEVASGELHAAADATLQRY
jgi:hypothetical protein